MAFKVITGGKTQEQPYNPNQVVEFSDEFKAEVESWKTLLETPDISNLSRGEAKTASDLILAVRLGKLEFY